MIAVVTKIAIPTIDTAKTALSKPQTNHKYGTLPARFCLLGAVLYETPLPRGVCRYPLQEEMLRRVRTAMATKPPAKHVSRTKLIIASKGRSSRKRVEIALIRVYRTVALEIASMAFVEAGIGSLCSVRYERK